MPTANKCVSFGEVLLQAINKIKRSRHWSFSYTINYLVGQGIQAVNSNTTTTINNINSISPSESNKQAVKREGKTNPGRFNAEKEIENFRAETARKKREAEK